MNIEIIIDFSRNLAGLVSELPINNGDSLTYETRMDLKKKQDIHSFIYLESIEIYILQYS